MHHVKDKMLVHQRVLHQRHQFIRLRAVLIMLSSLPWRLNLVSAFGWLLELVFKSPSYLLKAVFTDQMIFHMLFFLTKKFLTYLDSWTATGRPRCQCLTSRIEKKKYSIIKPESAKTTSKPMKPESAKAISKPMKYVTLQRKS